MKQILHNGLCSLCFNNFFISNISVETKPWVCLNPDQNFAECKIFVTRTNHIKFSQTFEFWALWNVVKGSLALFWLTMWVWFWLKRTFNACWTLILLSLLSANIKHYIQWTCFKDIEMYVLYFDYLDMYMLAVWNTKWKWRTSAI